ncbi:MAG: PfkB family carbohydrate kinase, partial [Armatimonadota bacterium]|nr:PfkB family carbohydrate kinase [Armatimonadota bacterium]
FANFAIKPNRYEAAKAVRGEWHGSVTFEQAFEFGQELFGRNKKPVFVTIGEHGILVFCEDGSWHIPAVPVAGEIDIVGAGDSVTGGIAPALCLGAHPVEAATIGNIVASITIQQIGVTGTATREQVLQRFREVAKAIEPRPLRP